MTKKTIKTSEVLNVYNILNTAKYGKMEDADKIKVWKITKALKPIATKFDEDSKDAAEKFKQDIDGFDEKLQKAQEYERLRGEKQPTIDIMTTADYEVFIKELRQYNETVSKAIQEYADKEVEIDFEPISEDAFGKLMASNEWTMAQVTTIDGIVNG